MQTEQNSLLSLSSTLPCAPRTKRGDFSSLDINNDHFLYFNGPTLILRPLSLQKQIKYFVHKSDVLAAKFSNDGKFIASIDQKGTLFIHELGQKQLFQCKKYQNFYTGARAIDWSADGKRICVVGSGKNTFGRVVLIQSGTNAGQITGVSANLTCCSFRPERPYHLVVGGDEFILKFYQGPPYKFAKSSPKNHSNFMNAVKFSPSGKFIVSVSSDKKMVLYNGENFQMMKQKINCHERSIFGVDWIDEKTFFTMSADKTIKVWNTELDELNQIKSCKEADFKDVKNIDHFQVAGKFYKGQIYALSLNGQISRYQLPSNEQKVVQFNSQKCVKYAACLDKPLSILSSQSQNSGQNLVIANNGRILSLEKVKGQHVSSKMKLLEQSYLSKPALNGFYHKHNESIYVLWCDGDISELILPSNSAVTQKNHISNTNSKYIIQSSLPEYKVIAVNSRLNGILGDKIVKSSDQLGQDPTFVVTLQSVIVVGTIKGNILVYNASSLQFQNKINASSTRISHIYLSRTQDQNGYILICGDSLGKFRVMKYGKLQKSLQQLSSNLGNHQSLITSIQSYKSEYLFTTGIDNKINLWQKTSQGKYSRLGDWRNVHNFGILSSQIIGSSILTIGGDYLIKEWKINL